MFFHIFGILTVVVAGVYLVGAVLPEVVDQPNTPALMVAAVVGVAAVAGAISWGVSKLKHSNREE